MNSIIPKKYILLALAWSLFLGCALGSSMIYNTYSFAVAFVFVALLAFINRCNKRILIIPVLILVVLWGSFQYGIFSSAESSMESLRGLPAIIEGVIADEPVETEYGQKFTLKNVYYVNNNKLFKSGEKLLVYGKKGMDLAFGDKLRMTAELDKAAKQRNFGDFDFGRYYQSKNIFMRAYPQQIEKMAANRAGFLSQLLYDCRQRVKHSIYSAMPDREAAILYGILTGSKSEIDEEVMEVFSLTGLAHILSVSGLHIGFLMLIAGYILKPMKLKESIRHIITFIVVLFYIMLIGAPIPALRALFMFAVMLGGKIWGQKYDMNASASLAAILLLLYNPLLIHDPSFIISFGCIYAIVFFHQPLSNKLSFLPAWLRSSLSLSIAVWIGITPVLVYYFNYISIINILLNVAAVPIAFLITIAGFAGVAVGMVLPALSAFVFSVSYYLIRLLHLISEKALLIPGAGFDVPALGWYYYLLYYGIALLLIKELWKSKAPSVKRNYYIGLIAIFLLIVIMNIWEKPLRINHLDVGQGDCSVIRTPNNKTVVIDGGGSAAWQKDDYDIGQRITVPALLHMGIWKVDTVIVSHIHDDHLGGVLSILDKYRVSNVILPMAHQYGAGEYASDNYNKLLEICKAKKISISYLKKGDKIVLSKNVSLEVLGPEQPFISNSDSDVNNNSLVLGLRYKSFDALFTGDIQREAELRLEAAAWDIDVLKVAHHGSPYSSTEEFLDLFLPEFSIISVGRNIYGHPSAEVIQRLDEIGSSIFRTDSNGGVMLKTDGHRMRFYTVRQEAE